MVDNVEQSKQSIPTPIHSKYSMTDFTIAMNYLSLV